MASIARDKNGRKRVLFFNTDGERKSIRLGKLAVKQAEAVKIHIEHLVAAGTTGTAPDPKTANWVAELGDDLHAKLASHGLVVPREQAAASRVKLEPFLRAYLDGRADLKPSTKIVRGQVIRDLTEFFGESKDVRSIVPGHADDFKQWLVGRKLASTTIHKRLQTARSFFLAMQRRKLIDENPFDGVRVAATGIKDRQQFVTREEIVHVLEACPNHHWRTIIALARYGVLRCPSEVLSLRWQDVDWETGRIVVTSPKTEHHIGKASRTIPLFPELREVLADAFDLAPDGAEFVVDPKFRKAAMGPAGWKNANLRTTFQKIVRRAGLEPWPRLFHNLRASRETELVETYPVQVVTDWLGNTPSVAMRHYLMTTDEHFESAIRGNVEATPRVAQNAAQSGAVSPRRASQGEKPASTKPLVLQGFAGECDYTQLPLVAEEGFEPPTRGL